MLFNSRKGTIALDIDGTLTPEAHALDSCVIEFLQHLADENWNIIFITGRPFQWGYRTLKPLQFPYALAVQNGALLLQMPEKKIVCQKYLSKKILPSMETICETLGTDFIVYSGYENGDLCYFRPSHLSQLILDYVLERKEFLGEQWHPLEGFNELPISTFSSLKCFADQETAHRLSQAIEEKLALHAPPNRDPFNPDFFVIQTTHQEATKGHALKEYIRLTRSSGPIIAAGNDHNDLSMLLVADTKIVMANAPHEILSMADIVAPPAEQQGIIQGLLKAIDLTNG